MIFTLLLGVAALDASHHNVIVDADSKAAKAVGMKEESAVDEPVTETATAATAQTSMHERRTETFADDQGNTFVVDYQEAVEACDALFTKLIKTGVHNPENIKDEQLVLKKGEHCDRLAEDVCDTHFLQIESTASHPYPKKGDPPLHDVPIENVQFGPKGLEARKLRDDLIWWQRWYVVQCEWEKGTAGTADGLPARPGKCLNGRLGYVCEKNRDVDPHLSEVKNLDELGYPAPHETHADAYPYDTTHTGPGGKLGARAWDYDDPNVPPPNNHIDKVPGPDGYPYDNYGHIDPYTGRTIVVGEQKGPASR